MCSAQVNLSDLDTTENIILMEGTNLTIITAETIVFTTEQLTCNRRYEGAVEARNVAGLGISIFTISEYLYVGLAHHNNYAIYLGTHGILGITTKTEGNDIVVTTLYSEHSDVKGALFDFVFIDDNGDVDFTRSVLLALDRNTSLHHTLPFNLYPGQYRVFVYDIESDGTLSNGVGYPAVTKELVINNGQGMQKKKTLYKLHAAFITFITPVPEYSSKVLMHVCQFVTIKNMSSQITGNVRKQYNSNHRMSGP